MALTVLSIFDTTPRATPSDFTVPYDTTSRPAEFIHHAGDGACFGSPYVKGYRQWLLAGVFVGEPGKSLLWIQTSTHGIIIS